MYITVTIFGFPIHSLVKVKRWGDYYLLFESYVGISFGSGEHTIDIKIMLRVLWSLDFHMAEIALKFRLNVST